MYRAINRTKCLKQYNKFVAVNQLKYMSDVEQRYHKINAERFKYCFENCRNGCVLEKAIPAVIWIKEDEAA